MQEEQEIQAHNFQTLHTVREEHYRKVQSKYKHLDDLGYAAHREHMVELEQYYEEQKRKMEECAEASQQRAVRDENAYFERRENLEQ